MVISPLVAESYEVKIISERFPHCVFIIRAKDNSYKSLHHHVKYNDEADKVELINDLYCDFITRNHNFLLELLKQNK